MKSIYIINFLVTGSFVLNIMYGPPFAKEQLQISERWISASMVLWGIANLLCSYLSGWASDSKGRKPFMITGIVLGACSMLALYFSYSTASFIAARLLLGFSIGIYGFVIAAYCSDAKLSLAKFSGSASFGAACMLIIACLVTPYTGLRSVWLLSLCCYVLALLFCLRLPVPPRKTTARTLWPAALWRRNKTIYTSILLRQISAASIWTLGAIFILGLSEGKPGGDIWIGIVPATNMLVQSVVAWIVVDKFPSRRSWQIGCLLSGAAWFCFLLPTHPAAMLPVMCLLGTSWSFFNTGTLKILEDRNPLEKGAALGLSGSFGWLAFVIGPGISYLVTTFMDGRPFMEQYKVIVYFAATFSFFSWLVSLIPLQSDPIPET